MKKLIITCLLLTSVSYVSSAQTTEVNMQPSAAVQSNAGNGMPPQLTESQQKVSAQTADKNTKKLQTKLGLSKDQYDAVYKAELRFQSVCDKYLDNGHPVPNGLLSNLTSERDANIKRALTAEQLEKYQAAGK